MSTKPSTELVPVKAEIVPGPRPSRRAFLDEEGALPCPGVEVVSDTEERHAEQLKSRAIPPESFFDIAPTVEPPLAPGATIPCKTLLGFLAAFGEIIPKDGTYPILGGAKITIQPGEGARFFLEGSSTNIWAVVAIKIDGKTDNGFTAILPIEWSKNVLKAFGGQYDNVVVGITEEGICLGPNMVPHGGLVEDFPGRPLLRNAEARAVLPAFCLREICTRVMTARSTVPEEPALQGVLFDFEPCKIDDQVRILCTAVATDGSRMHILRLPQMTLELTEKGNQLPPTITIPGGFFRYLLAIVDQKWVAFEISEEQIAARGNDYLVVAKATMKGKSSMRDMSRWRTLDVEHPGFWTIDRNQLESAARAATKSAVDNEIRLRFDAIRKRVELSSNGKSQSAFVNARQYDGAPVVDVVVNRLFLSDAIKASQAELVRLSFDHNPTKQRTSPIVVRGKDEQFKALIMPLAR